MERLNPRIDIVFKKLFGVEENKDLLISLVNAIVSPADQVVDLILLNPYNPKSFKDDKLSILDIKAKGTDGKMFNIEIQVSDEADYDKRALYYWAKLYTQQLRESEDYGNLCKAIGIHILNFTSVHDSAKYHNAFHITEKDTGLAHFKDLELHTIELDKFIKNTPEDLADFAAKVKTSLDMWVAFISRHDLMKKLSNHHSALEKALHVLEVMNFGKDEREVYEDRLKWFRIELNTLKKAREDGREEGRAEGREESKREIARKMLAQGMDSHLIQQLTGLDPLS